MLFLFYFFLKGIDCCSDGWISFHYVKESEMMLLATILSRHATRLAIGMDTQKPTFQTVCEDFFLMERVSNEMGAIVKK
jgi:hypothetical protein